MTIEEYFGDWLKVIDNEEMPTSIFKNIKCSYVTKVIYEGIMGTEKDYNYKIHIPELPVMERKVIYDNFMDIAMKSITERIVE